MYVQYTVNYSINNIGNVVAYLPQAVEKSVGEREGGKGTLRGKKNGSVWLVWASWSHKS